MAEDPTHGVPLPAAVEELIAAVCREKSAAPPDYVARRRLSIAGETDSLNILNNIRSWRQVRKLSASIVHLAKKSRPSLSSPTSTPSAGGGGSGGGGGVSPKMPVSASPASVTNSPTPGSTSSENKRKRELESPNEVRTARQVLSARFPPSSEWKSDESASSSVIHALDQLEFRKAFLILNYAGSSKLESVVSADKVRSYKDLPLREFEYQIWNDFGRENCRANDRIKVLNWESGESYNYHCHVGTDGSYTFKGPFLNKAATLLQKTLGDENVLLVKFLEHETESTVTSSTMSCPAINKVAEEGIHVGQRCFRFFVFKDGGREEKKKDPTSSPVKCYFVHMGGFANHLGKAPHLLKNMSVREGRSIFMHIHQAPSLSNYMARFSLILSKTITLNLNFKHVRVKVIPDVACRDERGGLVLDKDQKHLIHTDGTGFISEDLALMCPHNCYIGRLNAEQNDQGSLDAFQLPQSFSELSKLKSHPSPPLLIQFRMFHEGRAIKGTVLVNKKLPKGTIVVRDSLLKVDKDDNLQGASTKDSFEIVATSNKPKIANLSKNLIALLHYGGVPRDCFMKFLWDALERPLGILHKTKAALKVALSWDFDDDLLATRMIASGIPLDEPYLQHRLSKIAKEEMRSLKGGKLPVSDSFYLMGTADPTMTLNPGEVCVILEHGQISGPALVYRNPGLHPGDIHVVNAVYVEALEDFVGKSKYGIFFPSKGPRSMADEIAGGDFDGDMYWVSTNAELLKYFRPSDPWISVSTSARQKDSSKVPGDMSPEELERELFRLYFATRFQPSKAMGIAADSWLVYMDRILTLTDDCADEKATLMRKINELIDIYYDALDAPKKGKKVDVPRQLIPKKYPHHMERGEHCTYRSSSILGQIHDIVEDFKISIRVWRLNCFNAEVPELHQLSWAKRYYEYREEMKVALSSEDGSESRAAPAVFQKYRKELYGGVDELAVSEKPWEEVRLEALAIYHVCYDYAEDKGDPAKCGFAWKIAGDALLKIFIRSTAEKPLSFAPSVLNQMMR